ncbi:unnamed protein product [Colias eurytheme]|nr:unnamed protein product [Colias eurytheme]
MEASINIANHYKEGDEELSSNNNYINEPIQSCAPKKQRARADLRSGSRDHHHLTCLIIARAAAATPISTPLDPYKIHRRWKAVKESFGLFVTVVLMVLRIEEGLSARSDLGADGSKRPQQTMRQQTEAWCAGAGPGGAATMLVNTPLLCTDRWPGLAVTEKCRISIAQVRQGLSGEIQSFGRIDVIVRSGLSGDMLCCSRARDKGRHRCNQDPHLFVANATGEGFITLTGRAVGRICEIP